MDEDVRQLHPRRKTRFRRGQFDVPQVLAGLSVTNEFEHAAGIRLRRRRRRRGHRTTFITQIHAVVVIAGTLVLDEDVRQLHTRRKTRLRRGQFDVSQVLAGLSVTNEFEHAAGIRLRRRSRRRWYGRGGRRCTTRVLRRIREAIGAPRWELQIRQHRIGLQANVVCFELQFTGIHARRPLNVARGATDDRIVFLECACGLFFTSLHIDCRAASGQTQSQSDRRQHVCPVEMSHDDLHEPRNGALTLLRRCVIKLGED